MVVTLADRNLLSPTAFLTISSVKVFIICSLSASVLAPAEAFSISAVMSVKLSRKVTVSPGAGISLSLDIAQNPFCR